MWRVAVLVAGARSRCRVAQDTAAKWPGLRLVAPVDGVCSRRHRHRNVGKAAPLQSGLARACWWTAHERQFENARVARIQKRGDSLRNGAIIGAVVGVAMGIITAGISDCPGDHPGGGCPGSRAALFLVSTGVYSAIGTGIDALIPGRTTLYEAPKAPPAADRGGSAPPAFRRPRGGEPTRSLVEMIAPPISARRSWPPGEPTAGSPHISSSSCPPHSGMPPFRERRGARCA